MTKHHKQGRPGGNQGSGKADQLFAAGLNFHRQGQLDQAMQAYEQVLKLTPRHFDALHHIGILAFQKKNYPLSVDFLRLALSVNANVASAHANLGNTLKEMGQLEEALLNYDRALSLNGRDADTCYNRGAALHALGRLEDALQSYDSALAINGKDHQAWQSRAVVLKDLAQFEAARESLTRALALDPGSVEAQWGKALLDLQFGRYTEGWRGYESRWNMPSLTVYDGERPQGAAWLGQGSLQGKTILLYAEQGLGDTLQFCRYVPMVAQLGARVILEVPAALAGLLGSLAGVSQLLVKGAARPSYDCHCALMSLPLAFGTQVETIPAQVPYLSSDPQKVAEWAARLGAQDRPRVGVVWSGNSRHGNDRSRSIALSGFARLFSDRYEFVVLQKEVSSSDRALLETLPGVRQFSEAIADFSDTAALCELMDLVITVDTSVAHLAGALGKPAWVLLAIHPDWRWLLERKDSPWYPGVHLYRQTRRDDWAPVLQQVREDLALLPAYDGCPACGRGMVPHDVVDFNKSCGEAHGRYLPLAGTAVYYHRCPGCGFAQAPAFRQWTRQAFRAHLYNDDYAAVDPDGVSVRPLQNADFVHQLFGESRAAIRHLDYGAGSGLLSATLRERQWDSLAYDPFADDERKPTQLGKFNFITAFAAFERAPDVKALMADLLALMDEECVLIFSTRFSDGQLQPNTRLTWWYAAPRNGHISLFSKRSLVLLAEQRGLQFGSFNEDTHCLFGRLPAWGRKLLGG
ncbi:methyltransferase domain-containing protein [Duganella callida]|uniref:Tetratricopeptide repeat protein n=1 Tax=Duganella callida TaxID=2561932 RepID=A0A4Y9SMT3_9BURK|nr:methyltransferase domain-containing protein [Duganella callida]TFW23851.1 tetratricopeptide repeat protein [Duganella callida]